MNTFRAAYWTSDDGQASVCLTTPDQATLPDEELLKAGRLFAGLSDLVVGAGEIAIGDWTER